MVTVKSMTAVFRCVRRLLVTATFLVHRFVTLMMEALSSSETSIFTRATRRNISEDAILISVSADITILTLADNNFTFPVAL
jgi:hypothetical protein